MSTENNPVNPSAQYLKQSMFHLQSEHSNYHLLNVTMETRAEQIPEFRVCLVQPPFNYTGFYRKCLSTWRNSSHKHQPPKEIFNAVKLTLNHLPDENIDAEKLLQLTEPFIQNHKMQRQYYSEKLLLHGIVPFNSFLFVAILLAVGLELLVVTGSFWDRLKQ